jgi:hypothetical protein
MPEFNQSVIYCSIPAVKAAEVTLLPPLSGIVNKYYTGTIIVIKPIPKKIFTRMLSHIFITEIFLMVNKKIPDGRNKHPLNNYV